MVNHLSAYQFKLLLGICNLISNTKGCVPTYTPDFPGYNIETVVTTPTTTTSSTTSTTTTTTTTTLICPTGWTLFQSDCYIFIDNPTSNQANAVAACAAMGAALPIIQDAVTNDFVSTLSMVKLIWIDGMRLPGCTLGTVPNPGLTNAQYATYFQHSDGSAFNYYPWMQPCGGGYLQEPDEIVPQNCVVMNVCGSLFNTQLETWADLQCNASGFVPIPPAYVCVKPATVM